jgi:plasmid replication initiation protein
MSGITDSERGFAHMAELFEQLPLLLDSPLTGKVKNDRNLMVYNSFSLSRERQLNLPIYDDGQVRIEVKGTDLGVANIWDKEVLIYLASIIQDKLNRNESTSETVTFTANDFFRITSTSAGGSAYDRLEESLKRLRSTTIFTNIETGGEGEDTGFGWIDNYKVEYRRGTSGEKVMKAVRVDLCKWLYRAIIKDRRMLTYHSDYFKLGPTEKRLYEIARAHCGAQRGFKMRLDKLQRRVGTTTELRYFKRDLEKIAKRKKLPLPEYGFHIVDPRLQQVLDKKASPPPRRTPLKSYMVFFYRTDRLAQMPPYNEVPEVSDNFPGDDLEGGR